jgi:hypothetical protein
MSPPPPYKPHPDSQTPHSDPAPSTRRVADEEYGFWGEEPLDVSQDGNVLPFRLRDIFYAVVYAVVILVLVLNVDVVMSRWGFGSRNGVLDGGKAVVIGGGHLAEVSGGELGVNIGMVKLTKDTTDISLWRGD